MTLIQHMKLARYYQKRHAEIAAYSRSVHGQLTRQQALDYSAIWQKYMAHKRACRQ